MDVKLFVNVVMYQCVFSDWRFRNSVKGGRYMGIWKYVHVGSWKRGEKRRVCQPVAVARGGILYNRFASQLLWYEGIRRERLTPVMNEGKERVKTRNTQERGWTTGRAWMRVERVGVRQATIWTSDYDTQPRWKKLIILVPLLLLLLLPFTLFYSLLFTLSYSTLHHCTLVYFITSVHGPLWRSHHAPVLWRVAMQCVATLTLCPNNQCW